MKRLIISLSFTIIVLGSTIPTRAQFNWRNCGSGTFNQSIRYRDIVDVGEIISGLTDVSIKLASVNDIDIQLYDKATGAAIIKWPDGRLNGSEKQSLNYGGLIITWSGYNGDGTGLGNEYITMRGRTDRSYLLKVYGYQAGNARVDYFSACVGSFQQQINRNAVVDIGEIPTGLEDVYISLSSTEDVDIQFYDKNTGRAIVQWPSGILSGNAEQTTVYDGLTITWSGYNGDQVSGRFGYEFISVRGRTNRPYVMKAFGYASGHARVDYTWGKRFTIFAGIRGGGVSDTIDTGSAVTTWADAQIRTHITNQLGAGTNLNHNSMADLSKIAATELGGLFSLGFFVAAGGNSRSTVNNPGNSTQVMLDIEKYHRQNPTARVFVAGFSGGGGDVHNLLGRLRSLGIPVQLSGHIDSVEIIGGDARISDNTRRAMGFYQTESSFLVRGEDRLYPADATRTFVTNKQISSPAGPASSNDNYGPHRNMDNDERVWGDLLRYLKLHR